jgi:hypothetical protein
VVFGWRLGLLSHPGGSELAAKSFGVVVALIMACLVRTDSAPWQAGRAGLGYAAALRFRGACVALWWLPDAVGAGTCVRLAFGLGPCGGACADVCRTWPLAWGLVLLSAEPCPGRRGFASAVANRG